VLFGDELLAQQTRGSAEPELDAPTVRGRHRWAWLLRRVFKVDVTVCGQCGGKLRLLEVCTTGYAIERLMRDEGIEHLTHARAPPSTSQLELVLF
jgi:hypothetical protein